MQLLKLISFVLALAFCESSLAADPVNANPTPTTQTPAQQPAAATLPSVVFETSLGNITIELFPDKAPLSVSNFLQYVDSGFYNGIIFHRVVAGFVVQAGGYDEKYKTKPLRPPVKNESNNGLLNLRGTLSMARTMSPDSATSQFFINLVDNPALDVREGNLGYAVFGRVDEGMQVVDRMPNLPQGQHTGAFMNAPNDPIIIKKAYRIGKKPDVAKKAKP